MKFSDLPAVTPLSQVPQSSGGTQAGGDGSQAAGNTDQNTTFGLQCVEDCLIMYSSPSGKWQ